MVLTKHLFAQLLRIVKVDHTNKIFLNQFNANQNDAFLTKHLNWHYIFVIVHVNFFFLLL